MSKKQFEVIGNTGCSFGKHDFKIGTIVTEADDQTNFNGDLIEAEACVYINEGGLDQGLLRTDVKEVV